MSCLVHCKRCGSTDGTVFSGICPDCMHKELHKAFETDQEAAKHAASATNYTREQRTIRRLRALADGYRARLASLPTGDATDNAVATMHETEHAGHASLPGAALWGQGRDAGIKAERARIVARLRELAIELRAEAETQGDTVFGTVAAVQEKTIEGLASIIEKSEDP